MATVNRNAFKSLRMKKSLLYTLLLLIPIFTFCQDSQTNPGNAIVKDTVELEQLHLKANETYTSDPLSGMKLANELLEGSRQINDVRYEAFGYLDIGRVYWLLGDYPSALDNFHHALRLFESVQHVFGISVVYNDLSLVAYDQKDYKKMLEYLFKAQEINKKEFSTVVETNLLVNISEAYYFLNNLDSAGIYIQKAYALALESKNAIATRTILNNLGNIYLKQGKLSLAFEHLKLALESAINDNDQLMIIYVQLSMGDYYTQVEKFDSSLVYYKHSLEGARQIKHNVRVQEASGKLHHVFNELGMPDSAYRYLQMHLAIKDSIESIESIKKVENMRFAEEIRQQNMLEDRRKQEKSHNDLIQYLLIASSIVVLFTLLLLFRRRKFKYNLLEILSTIGLLFLFEFIALIIHPLAGHLTEHTPYLMLLILTIAASVLVPLHHFLLGLSKKYMHSSERKEEERKH